jgi:hypothetical protein
MSSRLDRKLVSEPLVSDFTTSAGQEVFYCFTWNVSCIPLLDSPAKDSDSTEVERS